MGNSFFVNATFNWLSNDKLPVDVRRESPPDNKIYLSMKQMKRWKIALVWVIPTLLTIIGSVIYFKRRRR